MMTLFSKFYILKCWIPVTANWIILQVQRTYLQIISLGCTGYVYEEYCPLRLLCWCSHAFTQSLYSISISINSSRKGRSRLLRRVAIKRVCIKTGKGISENKRKRFWITWMYIKDSSLWPDCIFFHSYWLYSTQKGQTCVQFWPFRVQ